MPMIRTSAGNVSVACHVAIDKLELERKQIIAEDNMSKEQEFKASAWAKLFRNKRGFMHEGRAIDLNLRFYDRWVSVYEKAKHVTVIAAVAGVATDGVIYLDHDDLEALGWSV